jgi:site-specific recombinase XerD
MTPKVRYRIVFNRRKSKKSKDGRFPLEIDCYLPQYQERRFIPTTIRIYSKEWNERDRLINSKNSNYISLNRRIRDLVNQFEDLEEDYRINKIPFHLKYLDTRPKEDKEVSFVKFWEDYIKCNPKRLKQSTLKTKKTALKYLKKFKKEVLFSELNYEFILEYEDFLLDFEYYKQKEYHSLKPGFIHSLLKDFKAVLNVAIDKNIISSDKSPFNKFSIQKYARYEDSIRYITPKELEAIKQLRFNKSNGHLIKIRDMFLLSVYTGLRYGDVVRLDRTCLVEKPEGLAIDMIQEKTNERVYIPLFSLFNKEPEYIIKTYLAKGNKFLFDDITNQYINRELKTLSKLAQINKRLTFHMGRHSCATILLSNGLPMEFVKEILGHKSIKTTQIYAKVLRRALEIALNQLNYSDFVSL